MNAYIRLVLFARNTPFLNEIYWKLRGVIHKEYTRWYDIACTTKDIKKCIIEETTIENEHKEVVYVPDYNDKKSGKEIEYGYPNIDILKIKDAFCLGGTDFALIDNQVFVDIFDFNSLDFNNLGSCICVSKNKKLLLRYKRINCQCDRAIMLCTFAPQNYFHFTFYVILKLLYIDSLGKYDSYPLLVDASVKRVPQLLQMLNHVNKKHEVIWVDELQCIRVAKMIYCTKNILMPFNKINNEFFDYKNNLFSKTMVRELRRLTIKHDTVMDERKIFITRKDTENRRIINEEELWPILVKNGYEILDTSCLSFFEQVDLFSKCKCIIAASGAALTNLIYCHADTVFGCVIPREYNFNIYSTIAYCVGCKILFFNPEIHTKSKTSFSRDQYMVDVERFNEYIHQLQLIIR